MQYNIYKVSKKNDLINEMIDSDYITNSNVIKSGGYSLKLYYNKRDNSSISWQSILNKFNVDVKIDKDALKGILLLEGADETYAITYGMSSSLVQRYCDSEFPMNIAKRLLVSKVKRKASKIMNGSTNSLVRTLTNSDVIVSDRGESVVNLELAPDESENLGKSVGIGKSVRINIDKDIEKIEEILKQLNIINDRDDKRRIPLFLKLKNDELIDEISQYLNHNFIKSLESADFVLEDMNILGSSIFFDEGYRLILMFKNIKKEIPFMNTDYVRRFINEHNINISEIYDYLKVKYISDDGYSFVKHLNEILTFDFSYKGDQYVLYDGEVYYYNKDFLDNIKRGLESIKIERYNSEDDLSNEWYQIFLEDNNFADVKDIHKDGKKVVYRELAINDKLSKKYGFENLDRNLVKICKDEKFKIEIADLAKENKTIYAVKVGTPRDFCYAIDQSNLVIDSFTSGNYGEDSLVKKYMNVKEIGLWFYVTGNNIFHDKNGNIELFSFDSIMFLNKLTEWADKVLAANKTPIIRINYYKKK